MESGIHHWAILLVEPRLREIASPVDETKWAGEVTEGDGFDALAGAGREIADDPSRIE